MLLLIQSQTKQKGILMTTLEKLELISRTLSVTQVLAFGFMLFQVSVALAIV